MTTTAVRPTRRGTSNADVRGNSADRRRRHEWLVNTYRADVDVIDLDMFTRAIHGVPATPTYIEVPLGEGDPACRCYRCAVLLTVDTVTADRIFPGIEGGKYGTPIKDRRDGRTNVRPACGPCNSSTGGHLGAARRAR